MRLFLCRPGLESLLIDYSLLDTFGRQCMELPDTSRTKHLKSAIRHPLHVERHFL